MSNATRQGCLLSPLFCILCLEPLAAAIHNHPDIKQILMRQREYKLSLFANDILLIITDPLLSRQSLHDLLFNYGCLSGYKVNTSKTEALPILLSLDLLSTLQQAYTYRWCSQSLKYLGVQLTSTYSSLFTVNYPPLFKEIQKMLRQWDVYPISLLGGKNVLKMSILSKLLYLFETLPILIPLSQLKLLHDGS